MRAGLGVAAALAVALGAAVVATVASAPGPSQPVAVGAGPGVGAAMVAPVAHRAAGPRPGAERWSQVLQRLDRRRGRALAAADPAGLRTVYRPGSVVLARDRATLHAYVTRGLRLRGAALRLLDVRVRRGCPGTVVLRVVDRLRPVRVRTARGGLVRLPHDHATAHRVVLRHGRGGWRIAAVAALSG